MTTSGTATFDLDLADLVEEAFERAGLEMFSGYDLASARRSLNIMFAEWANRGINMWTVEQGTVSIVANDGEYSLPADTVDLLDFKIRSGTGTNQTDYPIARMAFPEYASLPTKNQTGRPLRVYINRIATPTITLWPIPDTSYTFVYWRLRRIQDAGTGGTYTQDVPFRFIPAMVSGLAYYIAMKKATDPQRILGLKAVYDEQFQFAVNEDRERTSLYLLPGGR